MCVDSIFWVIRENVVQSQEALGFLELQKSKDCAIPLRFRFQLSRDIIVKTHGCTFGNYSVFKKLTDQKSP